MTEKKQEIAFRCTYTEHDPPMPTWASVVGDECVQGRRNRHAARWSPVRAGLRSGLRHMRCPTSRRTPSTMAVEGRMSTPPNH